MPIALLLMLGLGALAMPLSLVLRYRNSTARRRARGWIATVNVVMITLSIGLFLVTAGIMSAWVPRAFPYALAGLAAGGLLGWLGLRLSRWEAGPEALHYTPHRGLVLAILLVVTARIFYGFWRAWHVWRAGPEDMSWLAAAGAAGSLAVGALVLGYYLTYWIGVRGRLQKHARGV